jgi:hypothetical protein
MPAKSSKKPTAKPAARAIVAKATDKPRRLRDAPRYKFRFRRQFSQPQPIVSVWRITRRTASILWQHKRLFLGLAITYGLLNLILVRGFSGGTDVSQIKSDLGDVFKGNIGALASSMSIFVALVSTSGNTSSSTGGAYQLFVVLIMSLAVIYALRMTLAGEIVRIRDAFYQGMYPLIQFLLVLVVVALQCLPFLLGATIYSIVASTGIATDVGEQALWGILYLLLAGVSIYMLCSSLFALYIVTLPGMTPKKALRSARELVRYRRWPIIRKLLFLPLVLFVAAAVIMLPVILVVPVLAQWLFFLLTMIGLVAMHAYMYVLYRELLP